MRKLEEYISTGGKVLRCGYTTGTCAAAAARAATELLLGGTVPSCVEVKTPAGICVVLEIEQVEQGEDWAQCAVQKDAGDDPDVTDGVQVFARVTRANTTGVTIDGGLGVGRVTKPGLDQPVGSAAINSVPRAMIDQAVRQAAQEQGYTEGLAVVISIPQGVELAAKTFNPRLGIEGGISVLGTSGIVRPMSEEAMVSSIQLELRMQRAAGHEQVLVVPGNYGRAFAAGVLGLDVTDAVTCSNYIGATIDEAARLGFARMLLVGSLGKLVKVAAGVMNTHSRVADCRAEVMAAHAALAGAGLQVVADIMDAPTTDAMLEILQEQGSQQQVADSLMERIALHLAQRAGKNMQVEAIVFSNRYGLIGATAQAGEMLSCGNAFEDAWIGGPSPSPRCGEDDAG